MKKISYLVSVFIIIGGISWGISDLKPSLSDVPSIDTVSFSLDNALHHLKNISKKPHYVGTDEHKVVRNYIVNELRKLGLEPSIQTQAAIHKKWSAATTTQNIIAKIKGSSEGKALLLLTHYDSSPHSSLGASDAGSGVVTILEGLRVFLKNKQQPNNDIIILISDAEELGLLGAQAFVEYHPWAKDVGLVLNFEARGSGGASFMLMETNGKNSGLLTAFMEAKPSYPAANSLMYSVYKKLPNDTDLTVFREAANINGFNVAFIGDHFDYHTAQDSFERLDRESLLHQADYFTTMVPYFANSDLSKLNADEDLVYVNFPFIKLLSFPFSWVTPLVIVGAILFVILVFFGIRLHKLTKKGVFKGLLTILIGGILCVGVSVGLWKLLLIIHPQYQDILHGFTYNGYEYILAFSLLNIWILLTLYNHFFNSEKTLDVLVGPLLVWTIFNILISLYLKGAGFFLIPLYSGLLMLCIGIFFNPKAQHQQILFALIALPSVYIIAPMIKLFPVGLGLKNIFISAIFIVLLFGLLSLAFYQHKSKISTRILGFLCIISFLFATKKSGFSSENKMPNSLVYIQNNEDKAAYFGTYNTSLDSFTKQVFKDGFSKGTIKNTTLKRKYNTRFSYHKKTAFRGFKTASTSILYDTLINKKRFLEVRFTPQRSLNKVIFLNQNPITISQLKVNDVLVNKGAKQTIEKGQFLTYHLSDIDATINISFIVDENETIDFVLNEVSYDLLTNPLFSLQPRTQEMIPMPFITNDAIICSQRVRL